MYHVTRYNRVPCGIVLKRHKINNEFNLLFEPKKPIDTVFRKLSYHHHTELIFLNECQHDLANLTITGLLYRNVNGTTKTNVLATNLCDVPQMKKSTCVFDLPNI